MVQIPGGFHATCPRRSFKISIISNMIDREKREHTRMLLSQLRIKGPGPRTILRSASGTAGSWARSCAVRTRRWRMRALVLPLADTPYCSTP